MAHNRSTSLPIIEDDSVDPYAALRSTSPSSRRGKSRQRKAATASASFGGTGDSLNMSHLSFRSIGTAPRMPGSTPSLREQLRMHRMGDQRPLPHVESTKKKKAQKLAAHNLDVKARMNILLKTQDRGVIQNIRKENKKLSVKLADTRKQLADAHEELAALRIEVERLRSGAGAGPATGGAGGDSPSRPRTGSSTKSTPRPKTPPMVLARNGHLGRSSTSINVMRRTSTARFVSRSTTNDFAGFRARSRVPAGGNNGKGQPSFPAQCVVEFPWKIASLNLDDKSEDQLLMLQESGTVNPNALGLMCKLFDVIQLLAAASATSDDIGSFCQVAQSLLVKMVGCEVVNIWVVNTDSTVLLCRHDKDEKPLVASLTSGIVGQVYQNRATVAVPSNLSMHANFDEATDAHRVAGVASNCLDVPLVGENRQVIGVIQCLNRPSGNYSDIEESVLRQVAMLLGPMIQRCSAQMKRDTHLIASEGVLQVSAKLYSALGAMSIDQEQPDMFDMRKTLQNLQTQTEIFAERLTHGAVHVRVHMVKAYSSIAASDMLASLPPKKLRDTQDLVLNKSGNGIVGAVYLDGKSTYEIEAGASPLFNENIDIVAEEGYATYTIPVAITGHHSPLAVLQIVQPHYMSSARRELHMRFYERFASEISFLLLYFYNLAAAASSENKSA